jgi:HK97 family phage major capsid protein/HK97 family phage prohead protease
MDETMKLPTLARDFEASQIEIRADKDGARLKFPASSEREVERWFGTEVLSHKGSAVRLERAKGGAMPLLFNHKMDQAIGMIDRAFVEDGRLMVEAHLFETNQAQEVRKMLDGGLRNVSIGYEIHVFEENKKEQRYTATDWEPFEVSIVTVPADPTVGLGRAMRGFEQERAVRVVRVAQVDEQPANPAAGVKRMDEQQNAAAGANAEQSTGPVITGGGNRALELENGRRRAIDNLAKANNIADNIRDVWVTSGQSIDAVSDDILRIVEERNKGSKPVTNLGLSAPERKRFSITRAIQACADQNWSKAGFEAECSREIAGRLGRVLDPRKILVPLEIQERELGVTRAQVDAVLGRRDLTVATAGAGGFLVETANVGFIELLRNVAVVFRMGATRMPGMVGNVTIPKQSAAGTPYWLANEGSTITESQPTFVQIALSPKTVGGYTEISRNLLMQSSPAVEGLVLTDLAAIVSLAADLAVLNGSGSAGQPTGILGTSGIGSVTGTSLDYADIIEFQTDTAAGNSLFGNSGYVTTPAVAGLLKQRVKFSSTASPIWDGQLLEANVDGYRGMASQQMPAATMLFGDFGTVLVPEWGILELEVNPYAGFTAGIVGVRALYSLDVGVRYATAFSAASSIT